MLRCVFVACVVCWALALVLASFASVILSEMIVYAHCVILLGQSKVEYDLQWCAEPLTINLQPQVS